MKLINKISNAKTSTIVILTLILSVWIGFIPWVSFAVSDLSDWLLSTAAFSGPYHYSDKKLFDLLENIYRAWWGVGVQLFYVLTTVQLLVVAPFGFYLSQILLRRYRAGIARAWQFWIPVVLVSLATVFTIAVLYLSYVELSLWVGSDEHMNLFLNDVMVPDGAFGA